MTAARSESPRGVVADDDPLIRMVMRSALEARGIAVVEASSGAEAIAVADSIDFGVIDARMPGISLAETVAGLRTRRPVPLLVISGGHRDDDLDAELDYLMKPIDLDVFLSAIDRLLEKSAPRGARQT